MKQYAYDINLQARTEQEADNKVKALMVLASKLNEKELLKLADIVQNNPEQTAIAKQFLKL